MFILCVPVPLPQLAGPGMHHTRLECTLGIWNFDYEWIVGVHSLTWMLLVGGGVVFYPKGAERHKEK